MTKVPETLAWIGDAGGHLRLIDQTRLPGELVYIDCHNPDDVWQAIKSLQVRGAPAIGIAAAFGVVLATQTKAHSPRQAAREAIAHLATSRPTAVNLFWALDRMKSVVERSTDDTLPTELLAGARAIHEDDRRTCRQIGEHGAALLAGCRDVLTHCNAGSLATGGSGTALSMIFAAAAQGPLHVWVDETRPLWQGARLTAWELVQRGIPATLICDSMAASVMAQGRVGAVVVGADRIAANGDTANKIGTYAVALAAAAHGIPFYVAAPKSTFDLSIANGAEITIEERAADEISSPNGQPIAPRGVAVYNPAFDVTPARLIRAIICEDGAISPASAAEIRAVVASAKPVKPGDTPG